MKSRRGRRSEPFWPSIVMKKWLNIKPKLYDFSEDEIDTETESEDDASSVKDECLDQHHQSDGHSSRTQPIQLEYLSRVSGMDLNGSSDFRHRRGKSETLRLQYINTKEVRVAIGTWNVAGRPPSENLEIDEWLCTEEPADMYIIGFQEIVPLNAGNVLGAEDSRPIPKWEAIIRKTLNKSSEQGAKYKSYSAPPSPVLSPSSADDSLVDEVEACDELNMMMEDGLVMPNVASYFEDGDPERIVGVGRNLQLRRIYGDSNGQIDWPEQPLEAPRTISSGAKLRRVFSSNARIGCESFALRANSLRRSHHSYGNLGLNLNLEEKWKPRNLDLSSDHESSRFSLDGKDPLIDTSPEKQDNGLSRDNKAKSRPKYVRIISKQMVGIYVSVWVRKRLRRHINNLKVSPVGVGLMGYMGNKGSVSVSMSVFQSSMCFVCSHLTSGQKDGAEQRRNADVYEILRRTCFSTIFDTNEPQTIPSHDHIFWFGDLNYRVSMVDSDLRKLVARKQWNELLNYDQLSKEVQAGGVFEGWKEGTINFAPTYKYEFNSDRYVGEVPREGDKKRSPAWCDRILWLGKGIKQLHYRRGEMRLSDHRPVSSLFSVEVEVLDHRKLQRAINLTRTALHPELLLDEDN
ncbi:hypothetical protein SAY87_013990 [Trapa incisa]|uniref:Inositol polyphosphate-related phosphatase domain-containing protein n=1 Tax=Trapa incisa TaxID=236973 RepID=A0AAN7GZH6_9MYRT|nr:hypothetical protein SAY87_013990 [Trapa incisa]